MWVRLVRTDSEAFAFLLVMWDESGLRELTAGRAANFPTILSVTVEVKSNTSTGSCSLSLPLTTA